MFVFQISKDRALLFGGGRLAAAGLAALFALEGSMDWRIALLLAICSFDGLARPRD